MKYGIGLSLMAALVLATPLSAAEAPASASATQNSGAAASDTPPTVAPAPPGLSDGALATPASWGNPISTRAAIEAMPNGCIAVVGALGTTDAGIFGDILVARMRRRGVAALVTDGVGRDVAGVLGTGLPVWVGRSGAAAQR